MKKLSHENWLEPDPIMSAFCQLSLKTGETSSISQDEWVKRFLEPALSQNVPDHIVTMFEVARGAMLYGCLFYPLYTLGLEQVYRVSEAAITTKCELMGLSANGRFVDKIERLVANKTLTVDQGRKWDIIRNLRNSSTHANQQTILLPQQVLSMVRSVVEKINALFP